MLWFAKFLEAQTSGASEEIAVKLAGKKPKIPTGYDLYLDVFFRLNSERHFSDGVQGQIPVMKIIELAQWYDITNIEEFVEIITRIDVAFVNALGEANKKKMQALKKG